MMNKHIDISSLPGEFAKTTLDKLYKLDEVLTEDSTGTIYGTKTKIRGQDVAVNVLAPNCSVVSRRLVRIDHPNICKAHKVLTLKDGTVVVVIDKPEGKPILDFMNEAAASGEEPFRPGMVISAVMQLLSALHAVHEVGKTARNLNVKNVFVHRDKNGNIRLKLVSLGIDGPGAKLKAPHYFSPERLMNVDKGDPRGDIWAAGAVFYHLCFGRPPFGDKNPVEVAQKNMLETPSFSAADRPIPDALIHIIKKALDRDESKRYQTVSEMVGDLLPLQTTFNEPMSDEVSVALRRSYPPPPPGKVIPKKPSMSIKDQLVPVVDQMSSEKSETTNEYGKDGKKERPKTESKGRFFGVEFSKSAEKNPDSEKKREPDRKRQEASRTLLGIPAMRLDQDNKTATGKSLFQSKRAPYMDEGDSLMSARSLLGSDEEIKQLENELDFLEERKDEDVPTLVLGEANFAALTAKAGITGTKEPPKKPTPAADTEPSPTEKKPDLKHKAHDKPIVRKPQKPPQKEQEKEHPTQTPKQPTLEPTKEPVKQTPKQPALEPIKEPAKQTPKQSTLEPIKEPAKQTPKEPLLEPPKEPAKELPVEPPQAQTSEVLSPKLSESTSTTRPALEDLQPTSAPPPRVPKVSIHSLLAAIRGIAQKVDYKKVLRNKPLAVGIGVAAISLFGLLFFLLRDNEPSSLHGTVDVTSKKPAVAAAPGEPDSTIKKAPGNTTATVKPAASTEVDVATAEITKPSPPAQNDAPTQEAPPEMVTIRFFNVPNHAEVKVDGEPTTIPIHMAKSKKLLTISITADGFEPFKVRVVPDRNREVPTRMKPKAKPVPKKASKGSSPKKKKNAGNLVSNPFKK